MKRVNRPACSGDHSGTYIPVKVPFPLTIALISVVDLTVYGKVKVIEGCVFVCVCILLLLLLLLLYIYIPAVHLLSST
jgi:hypothetical protein